MADGFMDSNPTRSLPIYSVDAGLQFDREFERNGKPFLQTLEPRVFYLRYHGYPKYFPLWAMARFRNLKRGNSRRVQFGIHEERANLLREQADRPLHAAPPGKAEEHPCRDGDGRPRGDGGGGVLRRPGDAGRAGRGGAAPQ